MQYKGCTCGNGSDDCVDCMKEFIDAVNAEHKGERKLAVVKPFPGNSVPASLLGQNGIHPTSSKFSNVGDGGDGAVVGNCTHCGTNGVLIHEHKCPEITVFTYDMPGFEDRRMCYEFVNIKDGIVTAIHEERGRDGGCYWQCNSRYYTQPAKEVLKSIDKEFPGFYEFVKARAFNEDM